MLFKKMEVYHDPDDKEQIPTKEYIKLNIFFGIIILFLIVFLILISYKIAFFLYELII